MKKLLLLLTSLLLIGCNTPSEEISSETIPSEDSSSSKDVTSEDTSTSEISSDTSSSSSTSEEGSDSSSSSTSSSSTSEHVDGVYSVSEVREMCLALPRPTDSIDVAKSDIEVKVEVQALDGIDTKEGYSGTSPQMKVFCVDETGYILVASDSGSASQSTLYRSFVNNKQKGNNKYHVTGKLGLYRGQPEIVVTSYQFDETLDINYSLDTLTKGSFTNIPAFYDEVVNVNYNSKGAGIGDIYHMEDLYCLGKADDNSWIFTDVSGQIMGVYHFISNTAFSKGSVYDITGIVTTTQWKPSLRVLSYKLDQSVVVEDPYQLSKPLKISETYNIKRPKLDAKDYKRYPDYLKSFAYIYEANVYFDFYSSNVVVACDKYYSTSPSGQGAAASRGCCWFNNDVENFKWNSLNDYYGNEVTLNIYYALYQQDQVSYSSKTYMPWKVYMFTDKLNIA